MSDTTENLTAFLAGLPLRPTVVALGEPMHGSEDILRARYAVARDLVANHGYRAVAVESDFHLAPEVDDVIEGRSADLDRAMDRGLSHEYVHQNSATREFLTWLREFNESSDDPVRFYGFDAPLEMQAAPSPREYLLRLHRALAAVDPDRAGDDRARQIVEAAGDDAAWADDRGMHDARASVGRSQEAYRLRVIADDLCAELETAVPLLDTEQDRLWWARADARTGVGLLRYHALMADDVPQRFGRLSAQRDAMMAANLVAIADRERGRGGVVALAHNLHLRAGISRMSMGGRELAFCSAGALAQNRLGNRYVFVAGGIGSAPGRGIDSPRADTVEGRLYRHQRAWAHLYRADELAALVDGARTRGDRDDRGAYFPLEIDGVADADGVLFLKDVRA